VQHIEELEDLGDDYSVNDDGQFHLDSAPAIISDMLEILNLEIECTDSSKTFN
jgi:hypothetical protein